MNATQSIATDHIFETIDDEDDRNKWATPGRPEGGWPNWSNRKELAELIMFSMVGVDGFGPVACGRAAMRELRREGYMRVEAACLIPLLVRDYGLDAATAKECWRWAYARMNGLDELRLEALAANLGATDSAVMIALIELCAKIGEPGQIVTASHRLIAEDARVDRKTVAKSLHRLRQDEWIVLLGKGLGGGSRWSLQTSSHQEQSLRHKLACLVLDVMGIAYQEEVEIDAGGRLFYGDILVYQGDQTILIEIDGRFVHEGTEGRRSATKERLSLLEDVVDEAITITEDHNLVEAIFRKCGKEEDSLEQLQMKVEEAWTSGLSDSCEDEDLACVISYPNSRGSGNLCALDLQRLPQHDAFEHGCLRSARPTLELIIHTGKVRCNDLGIMDGPDPKRSKYRKRRRHVARLSEAGLIAASDGYLAADLDDLILKLDSCAEVKGKSGRGEQRRRRHQAERVAQDRLMPV